MHNDVNARGKVKGPAIAMIVAAVISILVALYFLAVGIITIFFQDQMLEFLKEQGNPAVQQGNPQQALMIAGIFYLIASFVVAVCSIVVTLGSIKMMKLQSRGMSMAAAIICCIPIVQCCLISAPVGIWALVVLMDKDVQRQFK